MSHTGSPYEACHELFETYPQAARAVDSDVWSIVIMLEEGPNAGYFVLSQDCGMGKPVYSFWSWPTGDVVDVVDEDCDPPSELLGDVLSRGLPIPRDGSIFGWASEGIVTALIVIYVESAADFGEPGWSVMPRVGTPSEQWPSFAGERLFRHWSWDQCKSGRMISLAEVIADAPESVWWVETQAVIGSDICAVSRDVTSPEGPTLSCGRYAYYQALGSAETIPSLEALLDSPGRVDLSPRLESYLASGMVWPGGCRS